jgi:chromate transporter
MTIGIFVPAFGFTLLGQERIEGLVKSERARGVLMGVTAAVVGVIAATAMEMVVSTWWGWRGAAVGVSVLVLVSVVQRRWVVPLAVVGAMVAGAWVW